MIKKQSQSIPMIDQALADLALFLTDDPGQRGICGCHGRLGLRSGEPQRLGMYALQCCGQGLMLNLKGCGLLRQWEFRLPLFKPQGVDTNLLSK